MDLLAAGTKTGNHFIIAQGMWGEKEKRQCENTGALNKSTKQLKMITSKTRKQQL